MIFFDLNCFSFCTPSHTDGGGGGLVIQSCPTPCDLMDCSPPGSSVHGILQARILEWVAISFSRGSFWTGDQTQVSYIGRWILYHRATWETQYSTMKFLKNEKAKTRKDKRASVRWCHLDSLGNWKSQSFFVNQVPTYQNSRSGVVTSPLSYRGEVRGDCSYHFSW